MTKSSILSSCEVVTTALLMLLLITQLRVHQREPLPLLAEELEFSLSSRGEDAPDAFESCSWVDIFYNM
jgi:hypothetical protein